MARAAVLASGNGSNFEALVRRIRETEHRITCLIYDRKAAGAAERAERLQIPAFYVPYVGRRRQEAEKEMLDHLAPYKPDLIVLAGFMRLLTPDFLSAYPGKIVNVHPSLLPRYPGMKGIEESYNSPDRELGITIHWVDHGLDNGPVIMQESFIRTGSENRDEIEARIHELEHRCYPKAVIELLNQFD